MQSNGVIRRATPRDMEAMAALLAMLFGIETDFAVDRERQKEGLSLLLARPEQGCVMVAECAGQVVGMCTGQLLVSTAAGGMKVLVEDLVVASAQRGRGLGAALLAAVECWGRSCGAKRLDLLADRRNHGALEFYQRRRWQRTELIALQKRL